MKKDLIFNHDKYMTFGIKDKFKDAIFLNNMEYKNIDEIIEYCKNNLMIENNIYKNMAISFFSTLNSNINEAQLNCDNGLIIDGNYILYCKRVGEDLNEAMEDLINIISLKSNKYYEEDIIEENEKEEENSNENNKIEKKKEDDEIECCII